MLYFLFLLLNGVLFLRPAELVPGLRGLPLYQVTILACLVAASPSIFRLIEFRNLKLNPVTGCVLLMLLAAPLSHLTQLAGTSFYYGQLAFETFGKVVLYYLVAVATLNSEQRVESFFRWLMMLIAVVAALSIGHERGVFIIPELASLDRQELVGAGDAIEITQLRGTGIFNDPNDLAMILTVGFVLAVHALTSARAGATAIIALPAAALCLFGLYETKSRGGMIAFLSAACVISYARWGMARAVLLGSGAAACVAAVFAVRTGGLSTSEGTAQHRIQLWSEGLTMLRANPFFGIGYDRYAKEVGLVAHNSFVHSFTELGLVGGSMFFGAFLASMIALWRLWRLAPEDLPIESRQRLATMAACLIGAAVAMLSLSRCYVVPTYLILAMASAVISLESWRLDSEGVLIELPRFDAVFVRRLATSSLAFLFATYIFVRLTARWG